MVQVSENAVDDVGLRERLGLPKEKALVYKRRSASGTEEFGITAMSVAREYGDGAVATLSIEADEIGTVSICSLYLKEMQSGSF